MELVCPIDGRFCITPICVEDPDVPPCIQAVDAVAISLIALGELGDRLNINPTDNPTGPDLMTPLTDASRLICNRLGCDLKTFLVSVQERLTPGASFTVYVDDER